MAKKNLNEAAQRATAGFFSAMPAEAVIDTVETQKEVIHETTKAEDAPKKKKKGFSFRGTAGDVMRWQNYGMAVKNAHAPAEKFCVDEIWCAAIEDYIKNNPLSGKAKELYDEYMKA